MQKTQISGNFLNYTDLLETIEAILAQEKYTLQRPVAHECTGEMTALQHYEAATHFYESIAKAPFHLVFCGDSISAQTANELLYAMLKDIPIIMIGAPRLSNNIGYYAKETLASRLKHLPAINLPELEAEELHYLLTHISKRTDYHLNHSQQVLIRSRVRAYLHELFMRTKV